MNLPKLIISIIFVFAFSQNAIADFPKVYEITSPKKKITAWVTEDNYLPIISLEIAFKNSGYAHDPENKLGISYLTSNMMMEGTKTLNSQEIKQKFESLATSLSFSVDADNFYISMKTLTKNIEPSLALLSEILLSPDFSKDSIQKVVSQIETLRSQQENKPNYIANRALSEALYKNHPYSNPKYGTKKTLSNLSKDSVINYIRNRFNRENMVVALAGDIKSENITLYLDKYFGGLQKSSPYKKLSNIDWPSNDRIIFIEKDIPQTVINFALPGVLRQDNRFYASFLMNHIFGGGGFESRMMKEIREENGLAYSAYSYNSNKKVSGNIKGSMATSTETKNDAINTLKQELTKFADSGATIEELQQAKDYLIHAFPLRMTKNENLAAMMIAMQLDELGIDFLQRRNEYVKQVSLSDINTMSKALLDKSKMILVVVGKSE